MVLPYAHLTAGALEPLQLLPGGIAVALYYLRARTLRDGGRSVPLPKQVSFYCGVALALATLPSPLGHLSDELFAAHMAEHLLIADIAALLIVLGLTGPLLAPVLRIAFFDRLRVLAHPLVALPLWAANLYIWHLPALYQAALRDPGVHALQHAMFIAFGINMWMCLFGPLGMPEWFSTGPRLLYVLAVRLAGAALGNVFVWSGGALYPFYAHGDTYWKISPAKDQIAAGSIMMVEGSFLTIGLFCWVFLRSAREGQERQELLDYATANGRQLSAERAARAVRAGRGAELRARLERASDQHGDDDHGANRDDVDQEAERLRLAAQRVEH